MAHDDVWDDSALIRSWDEALDEYKVRTCALRVCACVRACAGRYQTVGRKATPDDHPSLRIEIDWRAQKYHSIHASGGKLEDLPEYVRHHQPRGEDLQTGPNLFFPSQAELLSSRVVAGIHRMPSLKRATHTISLSRSGRLLH
jgi:hypothetical protein